jgi:aspartate racemase
MKVIGLLGGMSWESTLPYYQQINRVVRDRRGGLQSAKIVLYSFNFAEIEALQSSGNWAEAGRVLAAAAASLQTAGAELLVLCTNTMHKVAPAIEAGVSIPLLHIADPTAEAVRKAGLRKVGLLGTKFTMEQDFYAGRLETRHSIEVITPPAEQREQVHEVIYRELCQGLVRVESRAAFAAIIAELAGRGAQGIVLACTEISLLVGPSDSALPLFDTTAIHATRAAELALLP